MTQPFGGLCSGIDFNTYNVKSNSTFIHFYESLSVAYRSLCKIRVSHWRCTISYLETEIDRVDGHDVFACEILQSAC